MLFHFHSLSMLTAITVLLATSIAAVYARDHPLRMRSVNAGIGGPSSIHQRAAAGSVEMSMSQLQSLQSYTTEYNGWFTTWYEQQPAGSLSAAQLKQRYEAFDGRMKAWLSQAMSNSESP